MKIDIYLLIFYLFIGAYHKLAFTFGDFNRSIFGLFGKVEGSWGVKEQKITCRRNSEKGREAAAQKKGLVSKSATTRLTSSARVQILERENEGFHVLMRERERETLVELGRSGCHGELRPREA